MLDPDLAAWLSVVTPNDPNHVPFQNGYVTIDATNDVDDGHGLEKDGFVVKPYTWVRDNSAYPGSPLMITYNYDYGKVFYSVYETSFNSTAINLDKLRSAGFERMENAPNNVLVVYKVLDPIETNKVNTAQTMTITIPVDTSSIASGTKVAMLAWIADLQRPADAAIGVKISSLTAYGPYSGYGVTSPLGQGYTAPSSSNFGSSDGWMRVLITVA